MMLTAAYTSYKGVVYVQVVVGVLSNRDSLNNKNVLDGEFISIEELINYDMD